MNDKYANLISWLRQDESFFLSSKVEISKDTYGGTSLTITQPRYKNEKLISIPSQFLLSKKSAIQRITDCKHGAYQKLSQKNIDLSAIKAVPLLCFYIYVEWNIIECSFWKPFFDTLPTWDVFKDSVPCLVEMLSNGGSALFTQETLTIASEKHSKRMISLIEESWALVKCLLEEVQSFDYQVNNEGEIFQKFLHIYILINSRCLYYDLPKDINRVDDNFTMVPLVDFINHDTNLQGENCYPKVNRMKDQFEVFSGKTTKDTGELFFHYGAHSNDFLLNEYGFIALNNESNYVDISPFILKRFSQKQMDYAKEIGYYGDYTIGYEAVSFRTTVALCILVSNSSSGNECSKVDKLINGILFESSFSYAPLLDEILKEVRQEINRKMNDLRIMETSDSCLAENLLSIYKQYLEIMDSLG